LPIREIVAGWLLERLLSVFCSRRIFIGKPASTFFEILLSREIEFSRTKSVPLLSGYRPVFDRCSAVEAARRAELDLEELARSGREWGAAETLEHGRMADRQFSKLMSA
jgi:hypothetical protein